MKWGNIIYNIIYINIKLGRILKIMDNEVISKPMMIDNSVTISEYPLKPLFQ